MVDAEADVKAHAEEQSDNETAVNPPSPPAPFDLTNAPGVDDETRAMISHVPFPEQLTMGLNVAQWGFGMQSTFHEDSPYETPEQRPPRRRAEGDRQVKYGGESRWP